jgi:hypothetical protein
MEAVVRKPRELDAELKALGDKARDLKSRKVQQLGELVIATGADTLSADELAGALIVLAETKEAGKKEAWARRGATVLRAVESKSSKGGAAYAAGKTLFVFLNCDGGTWFPNRVARALSRDLLFGAVWVTSLQRVEDGIFLWRHQSPR